MTFGRAGYEQLTLMLNDSKQLNETLELKGKLSYDFFNAKEDRYSDAWESFWVDPDKGNITGPNPTAKGFLEQQYLAGIGLNWTPGQQHQLYLGYEFSFDKHAGKGFGWPHHDDATTEIKLRSAPWNTRMHSFIGEYQWQIGERFTLFTGARLDDHSKMDKRMFSPRAGLIFRQRDDRTFKLVYNKSVRRSDEASLQRFDEKDLEDIEYYDAIYEQQINDSLSSRLSAFYAQHNLINYSYTTTTTRPVGQTEFTGADWELTHHTSQWRNQLSLSYVKLLNLHLINPENRNSISAEPQGFGNDFAEVPNWTIKLHSSYQFDDKWRLNGSLISHLGVDGRRDMFEGLRAREVDPKIDDGVLLLNLGAAYQHSDQLTFNVNAHNVMGWLDKDLNNRFIRGLPDYRADVASLSFGLRYQFGD